MQDQQRRPISGPLGTSSGTPVDIPAAPNPVLLHTIDTTGSGSGGPYIDEVNLSFYNGDGTNPASVELTVLGTTILVGVPAGGTLELPPLVLRRTDPAVIAGATVQVTAALVVGGGLSTAVAATGFFTRS